MAISIFGKIYDELDAMKKYRPEDFRNFSDGFDALDREAILDIILDGDVFWMEYSSYCEITNKQIQDVIDYCSRSGYKYLHGVEK